MGKINVFNKAQAIKSREDLVEFLAFLLLYLKDNKVEWENDTLERYLDALCRFTNDFPGYRNHNPSLIEDPSWKTMGEMIAAAIYYE